MSSKIANPLKQDERKMLLELSSLTAKNKVFSPYERKLIYYLGHYSELFEFLLEKSPGLIVALKGWCKEKKLTKFSKKLEVILKKIELHDKKIKITEEDIKKLSTKVLVNKADKLKNIGNDDSDIEAFKYYLNAANNGSGYAQHEVGDYYYYGTCYKWNHKYKKPEPNFYEAVSWYKKSLQNEHPDAFASLGYCYTGGNGVEQNREKGIELLEKAHDLGEEWILMHLILNLVAIVTKRIYYGEDERSEKIKLQKYIQASRAYNYNALRFFTSDSSSVESVTDLSESDEREAYKESCLKLSKTLAISAFMEGDSDKNKKLSLQFLEKSGYGNNQDEIKDVNDLIEFSEAIFSSNALSSKKVINKEQKKIIPFPNAASIDKYDSLEAYRQKNDEEEKWIEQGEDSHQEFKDRIFFLHDENDAKNHPKEKYKRKIACACAIEISKKICGFLNNISTKDQVIRLGITNDSKPAGINKDIAFFKSNDDTKLQTKEKIKQNLLDNLHKLLPKYNLIESDYKKFKGTTYLNLIIKNKFKNPGSYIHLDKNIFRDANLFDEKQKFDPRNWVKDFFIRKGEDTVIIAQENVKDHIEELEKRFEEYT